MSQLLLRLCFGGFIMTHGWPKLPETMKVEEGDSSQVVALLRARLAASDDPREAQLALGALVLLVNALLYAAIVRRRKRGRC